MERRRRRVNRRCVMAAPAAAAVQRGPSRPKKQRPMQRHLAASAPHQPLAHAPARLTPLLHRTPLCPLPGAGACEQDIERFCAKVEPGEGRLAGCLSEQLEAEATGDTVGELQCRAGDGWAHTQFAGAAESVERNLLEAHRVPTRQGRAPSRDAAGGACAAAPAVLLLLPGPPSALPPLLCGGALGAVPARTAGPAPRPAPLPSLPAPLPRPPQATAWARGATASWPPSCWTAPPT